MSLNDGCGNAIEKVPCNQWMGCLRDSLSILGTAKPFEVNMLSIVAYIYIPILKFNSSKGMY
jgi:hypothetical protein